MRNYLGCSLLVNYAHHTSTRKKGRITTFITRSQKSGIRLIRYVGASGARRFSDMNQFYFSSTIRGSLVSDML